MDLSSQVKYPRTAPGDGGIEMLTLKIKRLHVLRIETFTLKQNRDRRIAMLTLEQEIEIGIGQFNFDLETAESKCSYPKKIEMSTYI